MDASKSTIWVV